MSLLTVESSSGIAITLPVVLDLDGRLTTGVTIDLSLYTVSITTREAIPVGTPVSIQFCFARNFAYMRLPAQVKSAHEENDDNGQYSIRIEFTEIKDPELSVLDSCINEIRSYLDRLEARPGAQGRPLPDAVAEVVLETNPRKIISLFLTDDPHPLSLENAPANQEESLQQSGAQAASVMGRPPVHWTNQQPAEQVSGLVVPAVIRLIVQLLRDKILALLPDWIARFFVSQATFAFIAHPRDLSDIPRKFPFARHLPHWFLETWFRYQWPFVASYVTGLRRQDGKEVLGAIVISPLTTKQMLDNPSLARKRVIQTARLAQSLGARIIGLGAFTSIVTKDGRDLIGRIDAGITTGNCLSAGIAVQNAMTGAAFTNLSIPHCTVAIIGAAGSVGSACARLLAPVVAKLILIDIRRTALEGLANEINQEKAITVTTTRVDEVKKADIVIAVTSSPHTVIFPELLKPGAIVIDAAQPKNVSVEIPRQRRDVLVVESAILQSPGVDCNFDLGLARSEALGCLSEVMVLSAINWHGHYSVGRADPKQVREIMSTSRRLGFRLAHFRNSTGYLTEKDILDVGEQRAKVSA